MTYSWRSSLFREPILVGGWSTIMIIGVLAFFVFSSQVDAAELRIIDQKGLTRASMRVSNTGDVFISLAPQLKPEQVELALFPVDTIAPEKQAKIRGQQVIFENVEAGSWQLKGKTQAKDIISISIKP